MKLEESQKKYVVGIQFVMMNLFSMILMKAANQICNTCGAMHTLFKSLIFLLAVPMWFVNEIISAVITPLLGWQFAYYPANPVNLPFSFPYHVIWFVIGLSVANAHHKFKLPKTPFVKTEFSDFLSATFAVVNSFLVMIFIKHFFFPYLYGNVTIPLALLFIILFTQLNIKGFKNSKREILTFNFIILFVLVLIWKMEVFGI